jgi:ribonuclease P protein component
VPLRHRFPRSLRLKRQRLIRPLFAPEREDVGSVRVGPVVIRFRTVPAADIGARVPVQAGFAVGRAIGSKPHRNRVRRVMREVYRVHQHDLVGLFASRPDALTLMVLYRGRRGGAEAVIRRTLPLALTRVASAVAAPPPSADAGGGT